MHPLETYIRALREIRSSGEAVPETSYYGALATLFNEVGKSLKPRVRCIVNLRNRGAGIPDGGLFTPDQFQRSSKTEPIAGQPPSRGAIEIKPTRDDAWITADGEQVSRYWTRYGQVLVTNYRDFVLVGRDAEGHPAKLETYRLAENESDFWEAAQHPRQFAEVHGERFTEYLKRVMLHAAPLASPEDVAWFLASYARDAKARIEHAELPALATVRAALEEALGLKFEGEKGEHFFRSTLVQTLFYGVFSAWVLWSKEHPPGDRTARFDWRQAIWHLRVPMIAALFEQVATPSKLGQLGLVEVLDWTTTALNRVIRGEFFTRFEEEHAVQYFYEPFLEAFDPTLRKELGVWYTPTEIVQYMVARVDTVLREELGLADGLADPRVYVLDPCCGTGAFLVEVLKRIAATLKEKGDDALVSNDIKRAAMKRVFGFEILPAPFVVSHLQLGLLLRNLGAPLTDDRSERARVYLTNALTGWEPPKGPKQHLMFAEMEEERDAAEHVKRHANILVVLGNPPYNGYAGVSPEEEQGLLDAYKEGLADWGITKNYLDDLYVRFFRIAERRVAEMTRTGVVCFVSSHSWVNDPTFVVLRKHLLASFDRFWVENLHGDRKSSEYAPDGRTSETVFAITGVSPGIQQGVVTSLWVKSGKPSDAARVSYRADVDAAKASDRRSQLLASLKVEDFNGQYETVDPTEANRFSFRPFIVFGYYASWPSLASLSSVEPLLGLNDNRGQAPHDIARSELVKRMQAYYDPAVTTEKLAQLHPGLTTDAASFDATATRVRLQKESQFSEQNIGRFGFKPFDSRWAYFERIGNLWNRIRPDLLAQSWRGNEFILTRRHSPKCPDGSPIYFSHYVADQHVLHKDAYFIPLRLSAGNDVKRGAERRLPFAEADTSDTGIKANLSAAARDYLARLGVSDPDACVETATSLWMHALAIGYAPSYLAENADGIRQDWPRIPLPDTKQALETSAELGRQVASLLDTENPVVSVTAGTTRPELKTIAVVSRIGGGTLNPDAGDLALTAGWGHAGKGGITMPGKGKVSERAYTPAELEAIAEGGEALGLSTEQALAHLGEATFDIYLNDVACWRNVPARVWDYTIGGYQVIKKWLSYRERELLGRALTPDEAREVMNMARRIAAILLLEPALDANYEAVKQSTYAWPT
jgi:hypothetical protein